MSIKETKIDNKNTTGQTIESKSI